MSYDLEVFVPQCAGDAQFRDLVVQSGQLSVDTATTSSVTVVRGARRRYSFTVDGPDRVEPEDVPTDVVNVVLGTRFLYSITLEGAAPSEIPHAVRFARRLAQVLDGAVIDQQTDEVWSRSHSRTIQKPQKESRVATVDVNWYCLREELDPDAARLFVATAQQLLPEALARRFGEYEPLQGKLADSGAEGFAQAWAEATSTLFVTGTGPCVGGHLSAGPSAQFSDRFWSMSLTLLAEPIGDAGWRDALRKLFVALADRLPAFYASAEVTSGHIWSGRSLWADGETEWPIRPVRYRDGWMGLPPSPVWWSWLGRPFADYFALLPDKRTRPTVNGILYQASAELAGPGELEPLSRWLPADLFAKLGPNPHRQQPVPLIRAAKSPAVLV